MLQSNNPAEELKKIQENYKSNPRKDTTTVLLCGTSGAGKTFFSRTCPGPVLLDSFDPNGTDTIRSVIESNHIIADTRFEISKRKSNENPFSLWDIEYERRKRMNLFDEVGTYFIDSFTLMNHALINHVKQDWQLWDKTLREIILDLGTLPCHVVMTAHLTLIKDEITGKTVAHILSPGQAKYWLPMLFSEVYVLVSTPSTKGLERKMITANNSYYVAKTRIGSNKFELFEEPNMKDLLKKANYPYEDKVTKKKT